MWLFWILSWIVRCFLFIINFLCGLISLFIWSAIHYEIKLHFLCWPKRNGPFDLSTSSHCYFICPYIIFGDKNLEFLETATLFIDLLIEKLVLLSQSYYLFLLLIDGFFIFPQQLLIFIDLHIVYFQLFVPLLILLQLQPLEFVTLHQHIVHVLVLLRLSLQMNHLQLMILFHIFHFQMKLLIMFFCHFQCRFDGLDLPIHLRYIYKIKILLFQEISRQVILRYDCLHSLQISNYNKR